MTEARMFGSLGLAPISIIAVSGASHLKTHSSAAEPTLENGCNLIGIEFQAYLPHVAFK